MLVMVVNGTHMGSGAFCQPLSPNENNHRLSLGDRTVPFAIFSLLGAS